MPPTPEIRGLRPKENGMPQSENASGAQVPCMSLLACSCEPCAIPQMLFNHRPGAVFAWAVECPYCGKATTWRKTEKSARLLARDDQENHLFVSVDGVPRQAHTLNGIKRCMAKMAYERLVIA